MRMFKQNRVAEGRGTDRTDFIPEAVRWFGNDQVRFDTSFLLSCRYRAYGRTELGTGPAHQRSSLLPEIWHVAFLHPHPNEWVNGTSIHDAGNRLPIGPYDCTIRILVLTCGRASVHSM